MLGGDSMDSIEEIIQKLSNSFNNFLNDVFSCIILIIIGVILTCAVICVWSIFQIQAGVTNSIYQAVWSFILGVCASYFLIADLKDRVE